MHAVELLHNLLDKACGSIDTRLRKTLFSAAETLTRCRQLSIAALGRSLNRPAKVKHTIKCMDRLFGNSSLHHQGFVFYNAMTRILLKNNKNPAITVDWSGLTPCGAFHFLNASIAVSGRALALCSKAYPLKEYSKNKTHREFLKLLQGLLPQDCIPIIVTDAGFRNPWFKLVLKMGWHFIGRVRNQTKYRGINQRVWLPIKSLYEQATAKACYIGHVLLSCSSPLACYFYLVKRKKKNRVKRNLVGKKVQCSVSKKHAKSANEPWLIASSLSAEEITAIEIVAIYSKRMQIEETFRDFKNMRNGLGLRHCRSFSTGRLNVALLIAALAMFILWLLGAAAKKKNLHYSFQSNTERRRNVLSNFTIGWQVLRCGDIKFNKAELQDALNSIISATATVILEAIC
jgi:hypothetical protein